jgi:hypothetical protein
MLLTRGPISTVRWLGSTLLAGAALLGCQAVLGDFEVEEFEPMPLGAECRPNSYRCREARLERCQDDRRGFELVTTCESPGRCDATAGTCRSCTAGELACSDGELRTCGGDAAWSNPVQCETAALCSVDANRTGGQCLLPVCDAGAFLCEGGWLLECPPTRDRWDLVEYCGTDARCDAAAAALAVSKNERPHCAVAACGDACPRAVCKPGTTRCSTALPAVELCGTDGQWTIREACLSRQLCDGTHGRCLPPACNIGDGRCVGQMRQVCSQDQTRFENVERCPDSATCAPDRCEPGKCTEGTPRCNGVSFERCVAGEFVPVNRCATRVLCDPMNGCQPPVCGEEGNRYRCNAAGELETCLPGRNDWEEPPASCPTGTICDERGGRCVQMP